MIQRIGRSLKSFAQSNYFWGTNAGLLAICRSAEIPDQRRGFTLPIFDPSFRDAVKRSLEMHKQLGAVSDDPEDLKLAEQAEFFLKLQEKRNLVQTLKKELGPTEFFKLANRNIKHLWAVQQKSKTKPK